MAEEHIPSLPRQLLTALRLFFAALGIASLFLGYVGVRQFGLRSDPVRRYSVADLVYLDLQLIPGQSLPALPPQPEQQPATAPLPWELELARFGAPSVFFYTLAELAATLFAGRIRRAALRRSRGHVIVCGSSHRADVLTRRLRASGVRVVTVKAQVSDAAERGAVVGDPRAVETLLAAGVGQADTVYACLDRGEDNAEIATTVERLYRHGTRPSRVYALIPDRDLCVALRARRWSMTASGSAHIDFFNPDEIAAKVMVREDKSLFEGPELDVVVVGTGTFGQVTLVELARRWRVRWSGTGELMYALLIGEDAARVAGRLRAQYAFLDSVCVLEPDTRSLDEVLEERRELSSPRLSRLYLCHDEEDEALKAALSTVPHFQPMVGATVVRLDKMAGMAAGFDGVAGAGALFEALGGRLRIVNVTQVGFDPAGIREDFPQNLARAVHERYLAERHREGDRLGDAPALAEWEELPDQYRAANRDQVFDIGFRLSVIGCFLAPRAGIGARFAYRGEEIEKLAEVEHERWMRERTQQGWAYGPVRDNEAWQHPDLVPWAQLPERSRDKDRQVIRGLHDLLADAGFAIVRSTPRDSEVFALDGQPGTPTLSGGKRPPARSR